MPMICLYQVSAASGDYDPSGDQLEKIKAPL